MFLAITGFLMILGPMPFRFWSAIYLMNNYHVDEYLTDPYARKLWIANMGLAFFIPLGVVLLGVASEIWWVLAATIAFALLVTARIVWKIYMRLSGRYRELARAYQWTGPAKRVRRYDG